MNQDMNRREFLKMLGLATVAATTYSQIPSQLSINPKDDNLNILIIVFDALSAGHMSIYGYPRQTTPNISKFANRSYVYHNHYSPANFTSPGTASLLTGVYPWTHRAFNHSGSIAANFVDNNIFNLFNGSKFTTSYTHNPWANILLTQFSKDIELLNPVNLLGSAGNIYAEKYFRSDFPTAFWSETILRGKEQYLPGSLIFSRIADEILTHNLRRLQPAIGSQYPLLIPDNYYGMYFTLEKAIDWIQEQLLSLPQNYLAYYHLFPPHDPYRPRSDFLGLFDDDNVFPDKPEHLYTQHYSYEDTAQARQLYDDFIANVDSEFGRLINFMQKHGVLENTLVVLTSDHGELFERGIIGHSTKTLFQNLLRIPLLVSLPYQEQQVDIYSRTRSIDVLPTLLHITRNQIPEFIEGSILPGFNQNQVGNERTIFALDTRSNSKFNPFRKGTFVIIQDRYKLIQYKGNEFGLNNELYDLENDPQEMEDLFETKQTVSRELEMELNQHIETINQPYQSG